MNQVQFKDKMKAKVNKFQKLRNLQDAVVNLQAAPEGNSALLAEALETVLRITHEESVFGNSNKWEVKHENKQVSQNG